MDTAFTHQCLHCDKVFNTVFHDSCPYCGEPVEEEKKDDFFEDDDD